MLPRGILAIIIALCATAAPSFSHAALLKETFDDVGDLAASGWVTANRSQTPGSIGWFQGNSVQFTAHSGLAGSYIAANFESADDGPGDDTISNWLISPILTMNNGDTLSFWTRSANASASLFSPDRLQVRLSTSASSSDVGLTPAGVGDFNTLLLDINDSYSVSTIYPDTWTNYSITLAGLPGATDGRFAFRYFVEDGGPAGDRSNYIGVDSLEYTAVPEPATLLFLTILAFSSKKLRRF